MISRIVSKGLTGLSLTIPFYNEEVILPKTLSETWSFLSGLGRPFELILGDDGSTDGSLRIAREFQSAHPDRCRLLQNDINRGRGSILSRSFAEARLPIVAYIDADLEIGLSHLTHLIEMFDDAAVEVCTGSKLSPLQRRMRARHRQLASIVFNRLIQWFLNSPVSDHQCGLKGFRRGALQSLLPQVREVGWAWDTEILLLAQKAGHKVYEFPVLLESQRRSKVPFVPTICHFLRKIIQFHARGLAL